GLQHLRSFPSHAAAVVDNEANGSRNLFGTDELNRLFLSVFEKPDVSFGQSLYRASLRVQDRHIENHQIDVDGDLLSHPRAQHTDRPVSCTYFSFPNLPSHLPH